MVKGARKGGRVRDDEETYLFWPDGTFYTKFLLCQSNDYVYTSRKTALVRWGMIRNWLKKNRGGDKETHLILTIWDDAGLLLLAVIECISTCELVIDLILKGKGQESKKRKK